MNLLNNWALYVILYVIFAVVFNQFYKVATKKAKKHGALTILIQTIGGISILILSPLFEFKFPSDTRTWIFLSLSTIFGAISARLNTTVRSGIEASVFSILKQTYTLFMIIFGITLFKETIVLTKLIGAALIIFSNIFVFYKKGKIVIDRYIILGILANLSISIAMFLDINISNEFNLPIYVSFTLIIPGILILLFERIKILEIKNEFLQGNRKAILITAFAWGLMLINLLRAYQLGKVTIVTLLCTSNVILNVIAGYIFLREKDNLIKKIIAAILIIISVILINF